MSVKKISHDAVKKIARFGCISIAAVYILVGVMAILSFFGESEDAADEERIMEVLLDIPFGEVLIGGIVIGLIGYIVWRVFEAITDPYDFGNHYKGIAKRTGIALSATGYGIIAFSAAEVLFGGGGGNGEEEQKMLVAQILNWTAGAWLVGAAGAITAFAGFVQFKFVYTGGYNPRLNIDHLSKKKKTSIHILAWIGYFARGIILLVIGYFLLRAAVKGDPGAVGDTDTAFDFIGQGFLGTIFFILVALGTIAYGLFMLVFARHYKFQKG